jgi:hypothetical protein
VREERRGRIVTSVPFRKRRSSNFFRRLVTAAERGALSFFARAWDAFLARGREDTTRDAIRTR